jgi:DNA-binding CsgD family transcriptional regulator
MTLDQLSVQEMTVVRSLAKGLTNREIAERLSSSVDTIKDRLFRIFDKLGVFGRIELIFMVLMNPQLVGVEMSAEEIAELKRRLAEQRAAGEAALRRRLKRAGLARIVSFAVEQKILMCCDLRLRTIVITLLDTGLRVGIEGLRLKWPDIDFEESCPSGEAA